MADKKSKNNTLVQYDVYYETVTRNARWLIFAAAAVTLLAAQNIDLLAVGIVVVLGLYNVIRYIKPLHRIRFFASKAINLVIDTIFITTLVNISGGLTSPYVFLLIIPIMSSVFWYGVRGVSIVVGVELLSLATVTILDIPTLFPTDYIRGTGIKLVTLLIAAFVAERFTVVERGHRQRTMQLYTEVEGERQKLLTLINSIAEAVVAVDDEGKVTLYNAAALNLLNTNVDISGQEIQGLLPLKDPKGKQLDIIAESQRASGAGIYRNRDLTYATEQGVINVEVSVAPIKPSYSSIGTRMAETGFILVLRDITRVKTLEEQRDEFVSVISHELKTPVAVAEANLSTALLDKYAPGNKEAVKMLTEAHDKIVFLGELIKDLTALTKVEQQALKLNFEHVDAVQIAKEVVGDYEKEASDKGLKLKVEAKGKLPKLLSSEEFIREVLHNLISNGLKYTQKGSVTVYVEPGVKNTSGVVFRVKDTGIGIGSSDQKKIYEKFYRAEDYHTKHIRGTGLGLYLVKKIVDRLNAKIWFESELGKGTTFFFELPPTSGHKEDHPKVVESEAKHLVETL